MSLKQNGVPGWSRCELTLSMALNIGRKEVIALKEIQKATGKSKADSGEQAMAELIKEIKNEM